MPEMWSIVRAKRASILKAWQQGGIWYLWIPKINNRITVTAFFYLTLNYQPYLFVNLSHRTTKPCFVLIINSLRHCYIIQIY